MTHKITEVDVLSALARSPVRIASSGGQDGSKHLDYLPSSDVFHISAGGKRTEVIEGDNAAEAAARYSATLEQ